MSSECNWTPLGQQNVVPDVKGSDTGPFAEISASGGMICVLHATPQYLFWRKLLVVNYLMFGDFFIWVAPFRFLCIIMFPFVLWGRRGRRVAFICWLSMDELLDFRVWSIVQELSFQDLSQYL